MFTILRTFLCVCIAAWPSMAQVSPPAVIRIVSEPDAGQVRNDGQTPSVSLPLLGFALDNTGGLRPFIGVPGSAFIGRALDLGFHVIRARVSPRHDYILATVKEGEWPMLLQVRGDTIVIQSNAFDTGEPQQLHNCNWIDPPSSRRRSLACSVGAPGIDRIALSPTGSAAAFYSESQRRVYVFTNLAQTPTLLSRYDVGNIGSISAIGISDDGNRVVLGVSQGDTGSLFYANLGQPPRLIASMRHPSAISFFHRSNDAVIADDVENKIYALLNGKFFTLASADNGLSGPIAIAVSKDNQRIFAGNSQSGSVTTIGPNGIFSEPQFCDCTLTGLHPTNADSVFRLTDFSGGPVLLFDSAGARTVLVPASSQF